MTYYNHHRTPKFFDEKKIITAQLGTFYAIRKPQANTSSDEGIRNTSTFSWAGALRDLREQYTSVELQHEILNDWADL